MNTVQKPVWETEPDQKFFRHESLKCAILRSKLGALCGYVQLPAGTLRSAVIARAHSFSPKLRHIPGFPVKVGFFSRVHHRRGYDLPALQSLSVHGGLTFSSKKGYGHYRMRRGVWVGFDCAHCDDLIPQLATLCPQFPANGVYRDMAYVEDQVRLLADQIWLLHCCSFVK